MFIFAIVKSSTGEVIRVNTKTTKYFDDGILAKEKFAAMSEEKRKSHKVQAFSLGKVTTVN